MARKRKTLAERFRSKIERGPDCWQWTASVDKDGYGQILIYRDDGTHTMGKAHRIALEFSDRPPPNEEASALHTCDNARCVNPDHLYWGDHNQNMVDVVERGRQAGERNPASKLSRLQVALIRLRRMSGERLKSIASDFGIQESTVSRIASGVRRSGG